MYDQIADIYLEIFPLNQAFLRFLPDYLPGPGAAVLDLGCGPGDYVDTLSRSGYRAVGIDSSQQMITQAQAQKQGRFHHYAFDEINQLTGTFDCVYCVGNSLSYLSEDALPSFLKDMQRLLKKAGHFILQVVNWDQHDKIRASNFPVNHLSAGRTFHRRYEWIDRAEVIFHTEIRKENEIIGTWAAPLYPKYTSAVADALQTAGLSIGGQFGDYQKSPFDPQSSPALILAAQK
jgi:SAM-dependent methyltransferase